MTVVIRAMGGVFMTMDSFQVDGLLAIVHHEKGAGVVYGLGHYVFRNGDHL